MAAGGKYSTIKRRPKPATLALIVLLHILALYGLGKAFAPEMTGSVEKTVISAFSLEAVEEEPAIPPENEQVPDEGASGEKGREAVARAETAPEVKTPLRKDKPAPKAASTGTANNSGAKQDGDGTGAAGSGDGTGSGRGGSGAGGAMLTKAVKIAGDISKASDYPIPEGGRKARIGTSVSIAITVGPDGLPKACRVFRPGPFPETNRRTCELAMARFRFRPATDQNGTPVTSVYGWKQDFFN